MATLFIILIAVVLIFTAVIINIGKMFGAKTELDIAVDGAALVAGSAVGSATKVAYLMVPNGKDCKGFKALLVENLLTWIKDGGPIITAIKSFIYDRAGTRMQLLDRKTAAKEQGIIYALSSLVNDPNMIQDTSDLNGNGETDDEISMFAKFYDERLTLLDNGGLYLDTKEAKQALKDLISGSLADFRKQIHNYDEPPPNPRDMTTYINREFYPLLGELMNLYDNNSAKYAVIYQNIRSDFGLSWFSGDDCGTDPNLHAPLPQFYTCDPIDIFRRELGDFFSLILQIEQLGDKSWAGVNQIMNLFYNNTEVSDCPPEWICNVDWFRRFEDWQDKLTDWRGHLNNLLTANDPTNPGMPLFPTIEQCQTHCFNQCDGPCQTQAKNTCCPNVGNNCCPPAGTTGLGGACDTEASNYCKNPGGQGYNECRDSNMYHFESNCLDGLCNQTIYQMWANCFDPLNPAQSQICCLNNILNSIGAWNSFCPIPGYCPGGPSFDCQERVNPFNFNPCVMECYSGPNGNDGKYQQCVDRETTACLGSAVSDCYNNIFSNQCFQDAYNACYPGAYQTCYDTCYSPCFGGCYNPIRDKIIRAIQILDNFKPKVANIADAINDTKAKVDAAAQTIDQPIEAIYAWKDTQGWHMVMVNVGDFPMPLIKHEVKKTAWGTIKVSDCFVVVNGTGSINVQVWRFDQSKDTKFAGSGNVPFWKFRYGKRGEDIPENELPFDLNDSGIKDWQDLGLLDVDSPTRDRIKAFLSRYGLYSDSRVNFGPKDGDIRLLGTH